MRRAIGLNAALGDDALAPEILTSARMACGGQPDDPEALHVTLWAAAQ